MSPISVMVTSSIFNVISTVSVNWATYFGGNGQDSVVGCSLDNNNFLHVSTATLAPDFPTINPLRNIASNGTYFMSTLSTLDSDGMYKRNFTEF